MLRRLEMLPLQLLLDCVQRALHLREALVEHSLAYLLLGTRHHVPIEALLQLALVLLDIRHTRGQSSEVRDPSANQHEHEEKRVRVRFGPASTWILFSRTLHHGISAAKLECFDCL